MFVRFEFISGLMLGLEFIWEHQILVVDLGILRVYFGLIGNDNDDN